MSDYKYTPCKNCETSFYNTQASLYCPECQGAKKAAALSREKAAIAENDHKAATHSLAALGIRKNIIIEKAKRNWKQYSIIWFTAWTTMGGAWALYERYSGDNKGCVYRSAASLLNPGFALGCELLRERFEIGK